MTIARNAPPQEIEEASAVSNGELQGHESIEVTAY